MRLSGEMLARRLLGWGRIRGVRNFLSSAYECNDSWTAVKQSHLVSKVNPDEVFAHIEKSVQRGEPPSAVDVDLLALVAAKQGSHLSELRDALYKLRMSGRAGDLLDSTQYSTIRSHVEHNLLSDLLEILDDRLHYGIFLCEFTASMLLNRFLLAGDVPSAARVASLLMLQEDFMGPLPESLAAYAAYEYVKLVDIPEEIPPPPPPKKKPEVIKVRVQFLRNPFFDDHFDIKDMNHLAGKTLCLAYANSDDLLDLNCKLLGWTFYKKYDKAKTIAEKISNKKGLYNSTLSIIEKLANTYEQRNKKEDAEATNLLIKYLKTIPMQEINIEEKMKERINDAVVSSEESIVKKHDEVS